MIWDIVLTVLPALLGGATFWGFQRYNLGRLKTWQDAASWSGLSVVEASSPWSMRMSLKARRGPLEARIEESRRRPGATSVAVAVPGPPGFAGVKIRREQHRPLGVREIELGDPVFDNQFFVEGPMRLVVTLLDAEARRLLIGANAEIRGERELEILQGEIRAETSDQDLPSLLSTLLEIGRCFSQPLDIPRRLAENARQDPAAGVRLLNLLLLVREIPGAPGTLDALRAACSDPSPEVRLRAAGELGAEGRDVLVALAESTEEDSLSARAVAMLGPDLPIERVRAVLDHSLRRRRLQTARACLESLGRHGGSAAVDRLAKVMAREQGELAAAAAQALGETGRPDAESPLILILQQALQRTERTDLLAAAAKALGRVGTTAAVLPLKEAAERSSREPEVLRATRQAIAEIQSRLPGASPGQLSLAGDEAGQLSLASVEAGQLSLATGPRGELSLHPGEPGQLSEA